MLAGVGRDLANAQPAGATNGSSVEISTAADKGDVHRDLPPITDADWSSYNHDVRGWRFNSGETTLSAKNASELEEKWRFPKKGAKEKVGVIHATPTVVNGYVYFGTATYPAFYKLKPSGTLAWVYRLKTGRASSRDGRHLLYGSKLDGVRQLFVRDRARGTERQITHMKKGYAAMWAKWQPSTNSIR